MTVYEKLVEMGYNPKDFGAHYRMASKYRGGKNQTSLSVDKKTGVWSDFGSGVVGQPFALLVKATTNESWDGRVESSVDTITNDDHIKRFSPEILSKLLPHHKFYEDRGISLDCIEDFKGGLATGGKMYQRYVFPIFDDNGFIVGFSGRDMSSSSNRPKWKHLGKKSEWLYPMNISRKMKEKTLQDIEEKGFVTLIESVGDSMSYVNYFGHNCLCAFGLSLSSKILSTLIGVSPKMVVISFNNDEKQNDILLNNGLIGCIKTYAKLLDHFDSSSVKICLPVKNDFGDMGKPDYEKWSKKLDGMKNTDQIDFVLKYAEKFFEQGKISEAMIKKLRKAHE